MASRLLTTARILLALLCAAALLYCLSYPDSILPRDPAAEARSGPTLHTLKPYLMWLPGLALLLVSIGKGAARILFATTGTILLLALLAWPLLDAHYPELLHPTFPYQGAMLAGGILQFAIFMIGVALLLALIGHFLPEPPEPTHEANIVDAADLAPEKGRTVQEILANPIHATPHFLFGSPDMALIDRFRCFLGELKRRKLLQATLISLLILALAAWVLGYPRPSEQQALQRDMARMFEIQPGSEHNPRATSAALHAAYRVMLYIQNHDTFTGLTRPQAEQWLKLDTLTPEHRAQLRDETPIPLSSVDDLHDFRTRFLTITDGKRTTVLFIRTNADDTIINVAEVQDAGWDAVADERRRYFNNAVRINY